MKNSDQPAFPIQPTFNNEGQICEELYAFNGFTKREAIAKDIVAALAPQFVWVDSVTHKTVGADTVVRVALDVTDELLKLDQ